MTTLDMLPKVDAAHPCVDAMRCSIPDDAPIWRDEKDRPKVEPIRHNRHEWVSMNDGAFMHLNQVGKA